MRDARHSRQNLNLIMNLNHGNELNREGANPGGLGFGFGSIGGIGGGELGMMLFNSPCKFHYSVNDSEWSEGIDLNLMNIKKAPLNLVLSMPPEMHRTTELLMSRAAYFTQWEMVPKDAFLLQRSKEEEKN